MMQKLDSWLMCSHMQGQKKTRSKHIHFFRLIHGFINSLIGFLYRFMERVDQTDILFNSLIKLQ